MFLGSADLLLYLGNTMYLANTWLVAIVIGLQRRESPLDVWRTGRRRAVLQEAGLYLLGLITARTAVQDPWMPLLMVLPVAIVFVSLKRSVQLRHPRESWPRSWSRGSAS